MFHKQCMSKLIASQIFTFYHPQNGTKSRTRFTQTGCSQSAAQQVAHQHAHSFLDILSMSAIQLSDLTGKVALVTGSSSGIGAAIPLKRAQHGASVAITGRDAHTLANVPKQIEQGSSIAP